MEFTTLSGAVSRIKDGDFITFSGMELNRAPMALINEIARQKKRNLTTVSIPNPLALDVLIKSKCVKKAIFGFNGFSYEDGFVIAPNWRHAIENSLIEWKETDPFEIIQGLKAGSLGLTEIEVPSFKNTDYLEVNNCRKKKAGNGEVVMTEALNPDVALIHAQYADKGGNVLVKDPLIDKLIAAASKEIIVSAEQVVSRIDDPTIQKEEISCIVEASGGAAPTSCFGFYNYDADAIRNYLGHRVEREKRDKGGAPYIDNMLVSLASMIEKNSLFATGVASPLPMLASMLARRSGKSFDYFNCTGAVNPSIRSPAYSSVTIEALEDKDAFIELDKIWEHALRKGVDLMFFGAAQIGKNGDVNMTCIGDYRHPKVKLPGPAGAVTLRNLCKKAVIVTTHHSKRTFVEEVDFVTSRTDRDTIVVTNLGILKLGGHPEILGYYPFSGIEEIKSNTGFELGDERAKKIDGPTADDERILREIDPKGMRYEFA